jgi:hypothetical protein
MFKFIGFIYLLFAWFLFDVKAPPQNIGWSIFWFSSIFIALGTISIDDIIGSSKLSRIFYIIASLILFARAGYELSLCNLSYEKYMVSVDSKLSGYVFAGYTLFAFMGLCLKNYKKWVTILRKTGKSIY